MWADELIRSLRRRGITLALERKGAVRATPASALSAEDREAVREAKPDLLGLLRPADPVDLEGWLEWGQAYLWPALGVRGLEVPSGEAEWRAAAGQLTMFDLAELRRVCFWQPGEREAYRRGDGMASEVSQ
jgi:hypothetical protein